jgi:heptosyltransferase III
LTHIQRILVVRTDRLGDVLLTLPMLPLLHERYPHAHIAMLLSPYTGELVRGNKYVNELIWYEEGGQPVPFDGMLKTIRAGRFDAVVVVHPTPRLAWLMFRAGIPLRIGTGYRYYSFLFNARLYEHRKDAKKHELEYNLELLKKMDCPIPPFPITPEFDIHIPTEAELRIQSLRRALHLDNTGSLVVIHPGSGGSARQWPVESFKKLAEMLVTDPGIQVCVTGSEQEKSIADMVSQVNASRVHSVAGQLSLMELAALLQSANLVVANSTGPLHLAVAVGTPVVGLYPRIVPMSSRRWGPYTQKKRVFVPEKPSDCKECAHGRTAECACMAGIRVEDVHQACVVLLGESLRTRRQEILHAS